MAKNLLRALIMGMVAGLMLLAAATAFAQQGAPAQKAFASPEAGASALFEALRANDEAALRDVLGRRGADLIGLREPAAEKRHERFLAAYAESNRIVMSGDARAVLEVGRDSWPFPIPLVKAAAGWRFDSRLGEKEVLARRIGRNELAAVQVCLAIADAEREYASSDRNADGVLQYSARFFSAPGKHDGLYWESPAGGESSPLGPFVAAAGVDPGPRPAVQHGGPYHGYHYRILTRQGKHAKGGAYSYLAHGRLIGGFAVLAFPAHYGYSGVKTFIVGRDGEVFEKDLGKATRALAEKITAFDPDPTWKKP